MSGAHPPGAGAALVRFVALAEPGTDRAHRPRGAAAHEAWSLAVLDDRGEWAAFVTLAPAAPFLPGRGATTGDGAFSLLLARGGAPAARFLERLPANAVSAEGPLLRVRVGESTLTAGRDHDLTLFELRLDATRPGSRERVRGSLLFQIANDDDGRRAPLPASRPPGPAAGEAEEVWTLVAADAIVRGTIVVEDRRGAVRHRAEIRGRGSIDHVAGTTDLRRSLRFAVRASLFRDDFAVFAWRAVPSGSSAARTLVVVAERGTPIASWDAPSAVPSGVDRSPERIGAIEAGPAARVLVDLGRAVERGPHYLRCRPEIEVRVSVPGRVEPLALADRGLAESVFPPSFAGSLRATRWRSDRSGAGIEPRPAGPRE